MASPIIRTFLGFQVPPTMWARFAEWQRRAGQAGRAVEPAMLHLTLCVIGEALQRDLFLKPRVATALAAGLPPSAPIRLGRIHSRALGAELVTFGRKAEIVDFFEILTAQLGGHGIAALYRTSGLRPHITLSYDRCAFAAIEAIWNWVPDALLLIESRPCADGRGREHVVLHRWPLLPPAQHAFAFMADDAPLRRAA